MYKCNTHESCLCQKKNNSDHDIEVNETRAVFEKIMEMKKRINTY